MVTQVNTIGYKVNPYWEKAKEVSKTAAAIIAALVVSVAGPIIGPLGCLGSLFLAGYHKCSMNFHSKHACEIDKNGNARPNYRNKNANFTSEDILKFVHEKEKLDHKEKMDISLLRAKSFAKCTIPGVGLIWAITTECFGCGYYGSPLPGSENHWDLMTPQQQLDAQIKHLKKRQFDLI